MKREQKKIVAVWMAVVMILTSMGQRDVLHVGAESVETGETVQDENISVENIPDENGLEEDGSEEARSEVVLTDPPGGLWTQCPDVFPAEEECPEANADLRQAQINHYLQIISELPAYLNVSNAETVSELLVNADCCYQELTETERQEPEVIAAYGAWFDMVMQSQHTALTAGRVTVNYVSPSALGEIENLVPRKGSAGPESESASLDSGNSVSANGTITVNVIHDQGTGGNQEMYALSSEGVVLDQAAKLTVRYVNIGTYYEGRIYTDQNVPGIRVNAIVTISNPYNANRISLYENFWMGGTVNGGSGRLGYGTGTPGRADISITFCDQNWNVIRLKEDAQLISSSISHGYYKGCSYEGISFSEAEADTTVRIYSQTYGNIGIDSGERFGLGQTFYGQRTWKDYCSGEGGPHSDGQYYADTRQSTTFMVHGVGFYQNADTWKMTMTTQTEYSGGHDYWFYFTAAPANMARPAAPVKTVSKNEVQTGETLVYTLEQKLSTVQEDGYGYYGSLVFFDTLPPEVEYLSASMYLSGVDVTKSAGTLSYNTAEGKVTYTFSTSYLKNMDYRGQMAVLMINCRLREDIYGTGSIVNEGHVSVCGQVKSGVAVFTPLYKITTEVVNGTIDSPVTGIRPGEERRINYHPQKGYVIESVTVDGADVEKGSALTGYTFSSIASNHHIRVIYRITEPDRMIRITKRIRESDIMFDHGVPVFLLRMEGQDIFGEQRICYGAAVFTEEVINTNAGADGYVSVDVVFDGLMPGVYTVSEEGTNRYEMEMVTAGENAVVGSGGITFDLTEGQVGSASIVNRKYEQGGFSHSCFVENVLGKN